MLRLALQSLLSRSLTALLTASAIVLSTVLYLSVDSLRHSVRESFTGTVSGTDLIVGGRAGSIQLLLFSVFGIGNATNDISARSWNLIDRHPLTAWTVPISLGDSHRGFRVIGTTSAFFDRYRHHGGRALSFAAGQRFEERSDAVLGADVAAELGYRIDDRVVIAHGTGQVSFVKHSGHPFRVGGVLAPTGTPLDRTIQVPLDAIEALHGRHEGAAHDDDHGDEHQDAHEEDHDDAHTDRETTSPRITALLVGLKAPASVLRLQRRINTYRGEPLSAIIPGVVLQELWQVVGIAETALIGVSLLVIATALLGLMAAIVASLSERRREMAILRSLGASPVTISGLLSLEAVIVSLCGGLTGIALCHAALGAASGWLRHGFGLIVESGDLSAREPMLLAAIVTAAFAASLVPSWLAYRQTVADGMTVRG